MEVEVKGNKGGILCVLNVVDTEKGHRIADELLKWLEVSYEVHVVRHDGSSYEHEGIRYMQKLIEERRRCCLYLHTKGAYNHPINSRMVRNMWKSEFGGRERMELYLDVVSRNSMYVACPFSGPDRLTRYNGFFVGADAMRHLDLSYVHERLWYEMMWSKDWFVRVVAMKYWGSLKMMHRILEEEFL